VGASGQVWCQAPDVSRGDGALHLAARTADNEPVMALRPRVLVVITLAEVGGAQSYVASLLPALAERFEVAVAAHGPGPLEQAAREAGVRYIPLRHVRRPLSPWQDFLAVVELFRLFRRERPAAVHLNSSTAL